MSEQRLAQIDLVSLTSSRQYFSSPIAWEDQIQLHSLIKGVSIIGITILNSTREISTT